MRYIFLLYTILFALTVKAQNISNETISALNYLYLGYTEYGVRELIKSSRQNDLSAQYYLAVCYENGVVVQEDKSEAFTLYRKSAERGLPDAMYKVALFYKRGEIFSYSETKYAEWMKRFERRGGK